MWAVLLVKTFIDFWVLVSSCLVLLKTPFGGLADKCSCLSYSSYQEENNRKQLQLKTTVNEDYQMIDDVAASIGSLLLVSTFVDGGRRRRPDRCLPERHQPDGAGDA